MQFTFRRAKPADCDQIIALLENIAALHHNGRPDIYKAGIRKYSPEEFAFLLEDEDSPVFVAADENDRVMGYIFGELHRYKNHPYFTDRTELYIDDFCVDEHLRGQHIGTRLFEGVKAWAKQSGIDFIYLNVWEFNESAIRFYESLGMTTRRRYMELKI